MWPSRCGVKPTWSWSNAVGRMSSSSEPGESEEDCSSQTVSSEDENVGDGSSDDNGETDQEEDSNLSEVKQLEEARKKPGVKLGGGRGEGKKENAKGSDRGGQPSASVPGIVYLSRVPPFMKPHKVKNLLSRYGSVGRIYLKPEG